MENKKLNAPVACHLSLMGILCVMSIVSAFIIFSGQVPEGYGVTNSTAHQTQTYIVGAGHVLNVLALICGMYYLLKGAGKNVAVVYKSFLLLIMLGLVMRLIGRFVFPGFDVAAALMIGSILMLMILTFGKDLGKTNTWIAFWILFVLDLVVAILMFDSREVLSSIASGLTRLVLDGSIGIAIAAKYKDKASRGKK